MDCWKAEVATQASRLLGNLAQPQEPLMDCWKAPVVVQPLRLPRGLATPWERLFGAPQSPQRLPPEGFFKVRPPASGGRLGAELETLRADAVSPTCRPENPAVPRAG
ncbi:hypothetical protein BESB_040770 [Besnoitia besnoiti]|uniref:Uncharacterized protein n=1 Tax=Besnoitia besnoiti TaxID=94643 RepID=A0A2A9MI94_BESBE|nr:hypothetical protein BESB_040770 [Besnoitia besnoiti]PFH37619.1 hypothetical protein BESB_040770 [Besnoitia besnoiti]